MTEVLGRYLDDKDAYRDFIEAMKLAESAAKRLAFIRNQKQWLVIEFALASARERATHLATARL
jgi:hypothetical protein